MADSTGKKQRGRGRPFVKGQSGNPAGRSRGSRNKITEDFIEGMAEDFEIHGAAAIERVRIEKPDVYLRIVSLFLPREVFHDAAVAADLSEAELDRRIRAMADELGLEITEKKH